MESSEGCRVLVVDDDDNYRRYISLILSRKGFLVQEACLGSEAIEMAMAVPDIILLDVNLPDMDGYQICRVLKSDLKTRAIPVIHFTSASASSKEKATALAGGADGYLTKEAEAQEILATINVMLRLTRAEKKACDDAARWHETFNALNDGICILTSAGVIVQCNTAFQYIVKRTEEEIIGRTCHTLVHQQQRVENCPFEKALVTRKRENQIMKLDKRWFNIIVNPVFEDSGRARHYVHVMSDITDHRLYEEMLIENKQLMQDFIDNTTSPIYMIDLEGRFMLVNKKLESILGAPQNEIVGKVREVFLPAAAAEEHRKNDLTVIKAGIPLTIEEFNPQPDGVHVYLSVKFPLFNREGRMYATGGISTDITDIKKAETALRESEARYRALVDSSAEHFFMLSREGVFLASNDRVERFGLSLGSEIVGKGLADVFPQELTLLYREKQKQVFATSSPVCFEHQHVSQGGHSSYHSVTLYPIRQGGELTTIGGACRDITEYRQIEEQLRQAQKMEAIGRLAGGIAHDFNNKLSIIVGYAGLMRETLDSNDPLTEDVEEILKAARQSAELTAQLLAFARRQTIEPKTLNLNDSIKKSEKMLRRLVGEDITLKFNETPVLWSVKMDPMQVDQILANLAANARDAIPGSGSILIETSNTELDDSYQSIYSDIIPGEYVLLSFTDNGTGMDRETLCHIFEPFYTTKDQGKGTGLGLATVYGIVRQNGGFTHVYSEPGEGTVFRIYLPRNIGAVEVKEELKSTKLLRGRETVLVVEDDEFILKLSKRILESLGYRVIASRTPCDAIVIIEKSEEQFSLLVTDVIMPILNGKELQQRLEMIRPGFRTLFMSGYTADVMAQRGVLEMGARFLQKPFTVESLAQKIRETLDE
ncbi:MAG: PAS domain S-box protein [Candidatus Xenobiia bacterium LiM19]